MFIGVKDFIAQYKEPFDREAKAKRIARERLRNKGIVRATKDQIEDEIEEVLEEWVTKANWGINAHKELQEKGLIQYPDAIIEEYKEGKVNNDTPSEAILQINSLKRNQRYYEKFIYDPINKLVAYVDEVFVDKKGYIHVVEYKTTNNLNKNYTFLTPKGPIISKYFKPIENIIDCNFSQAALQASMYMYLLWYYNKKLKTGTITIKHIKLNEDTGRIETINDHNSPYLIEEVKKLLQHKKK